MKYDEINETGYTTCSDCGKRFHGDDLNSDWLCPKCEQQHCALCGDKYSVSELNDSEIGRVCDDCNDWMQEEKKIAVSDNLVNDFFENINEIINYKPNPIHS